MVSGVHACITKLMCCAGRKGLHNVNLLASDERSDWPPVSPLSMTRCFPELWVITHLGIRRWARPWMWVKKSARLIGAVQKPFVASSMDCCKRKASSLPGFNWVRMCRLCCSHPCSTSSMEILVAGCSEKIPYGGAYPTAGRPFTRPCGKDTSDHDVSNTRMAKSPRSRCRVTSWMAGSWNVRKCKVTPCQRRFSSFSAPMACSRHALRGGWPGW